MNEHIQITESTIHAGVQRTVDISFSLFTKHRVQSSRKTVCKSIILNTTEC